MHRVRAVVFAGMLLALASPAGAEAGREACLDPAAAERILACERFLAEAPLDRDAALALVEALERAGEHGRAVDVLEDLARRFPGDAVVARRLAVAQSNLEEQEWLATSSAASQVAADLYVARVRCTGLDGAEALAACDAALVRHPGDAALNAGRGDALVTLGRIEDAATAYRRALAAAPDDASVQNKLASITGRAQPTREPAAAAAPDGLEQGLQVLKDLADRGLISAQEYEARSRALLDRAFGSPVAAASVTEAAAAPATAIVPDIDFGRYHALVIGIDSYPDLPRLDTARSDARAVAEVLQTLYGYEVTLLLDANRAEIITALDSYRARLGETDNFLIYYAGHGHLDEDADQGFWLPVDARADTRVNWISNDTIRDTARALKAKHLLVIADSCFSGTLTRSFTVPAAPTADYLRNIARKKARLALSSGGLEPVADSGGDGHSPFARALLDALRENRAVLDGASLFAEIRRPVVVNAEQTPEYADIRLAGHDGGDFLFVRRVP